MPPVNKVTTSVVREPKPPKAAAPEPAEVKYPEFKQQVCDGEFAITGPMAAEHLGIITEEEHARKTAAEAGVALKNGKKRPEIKFNDDDVTFVDPDTKERVHCANNKYNREFKMPATLGYKQTILFRKWAGPTNFPGRTINGEPILISQAGHVLGGQKRFVAVWLAWREWVRNYERWQRLWPKETYPNGPVMETAVTVGVSDDLEIIQTIDNVDPRTEADTFFVGEENSAVAKIFGAERIALPAGHKHHIDRKERVVASKILAAAVDFLWKRLDWDKRMVKTNLAAQEFLDLFPSLYKAVKHVHEVARSLSLLRVSPGWTAGAMVLMAAGKSNPMKKPESEKDCDMALWSKAESFVTALAKKEGQFALVANTLARLINADEEELNGNAVQKFCVIAEAWRLWLDGRKLTPLKDGGANPPAVELLLKTETGENGVPHLIDPPDFGGIDRGPKTPKPEEAEPVPPTPAEIEAQKKALKDEAAKKARDATAKKLMANRAAKAGGKPGALTPTPTTANPATKPAPAKKPAPTVAAK